MGIWEEMEREAEARGEARGEVRATEKIARSMLKAGKSALDEVASICGLTLQRVEELAKTVL